jgi:hypothetical protein
MNNKMRDVISLLFQLMSIKGKGKISPSKIVMSEPLSLYKLKDNWVLYFTARYEDAIDLYYADLGSIKDLDGVIGFFVWYDLSRNTYNISPNPAPPDEKEWTNLVIIPVSIVEKTELFNDVS